MSKMFYTYIHKRATDESVFYVGKGTGRRAWSLHNRNKYWKNTQLKHGLIVQIVASWATEKEAFDHEKFLIKYYSDLKCNLVNMTKGGEGISGYSHSEQTIKKIKITLSKPEVKRKRSISQTGKQKTEEHKRKLSESLLGKPKTQSAIESVSKAMLKAEVKAKVSAAIKAAMAKPEVKKRISDACKEAAKRPETKKRRSDWQIGKILTSSTKKAISQGVKKALANPETREKLSLAAKSAWEKRKAKKELTFSEKQANLTTSIL